MTFPAFALSDVECVCLSCWHEGPASVAYRCQGCGGWVDAPYFHTAVGVDCNGDPFPTQCGPVDQEARCTQCGSTNVEEYHAWRQRMADTSAGREHDESEHGDGLTTEE